MTAMRVLYFTKSSGYEHDVVRWHGGPGTSYTEKILARMGAGNDIDFTFSKDASLFAPAYLAGFDAFLFYTSGDLTSVGTDGNPATTAAGKAALLDAVRAGKGFLGVHSGGDTFHTLEHGGGNPADRTNRYKIHGEACDPYIRMLGGEFINHGEQQVASARVVDPHFPGCNSLGGKCRCREEWYSLKEFASDLHVLLVMETDAMTGVDYARPPYPLAWARTYGEGRVWYNGMGHREDVWVSSAFQSMLVGGLLWAGRRVEADVTPNIATVTPQAMVLPPERPGT